MIRYFAQHPTAATLLMLILLIMGAFGLRSLRRETLPDFTPEEVEIRVLYPGATAAEVEEAVCQRLEDALDGVRFVKELRSEAREGWGVVTLEMNEGADIITFKDEIDTEVALTVGHLFHADHAIAVVVKDHDDEIEAEANGRLEILTIHHKSAITADHYYFSLRVHQFRSDGRWQADTHAAE